LLTLFIIPLQVKISTPAFLLIFGKLGKPDLRLAGLGNELKQVHTASAVLSTCEYPQQRHFLIKTIFFRDCLKAEGQGKIGA